MGWLYEVNDIIARAVANMAPTTATSQPGTRVERIPRSDASTGVIYNLGVTSALVAHNDFAPLLGSLELHALAGMEELGLGGAAQPVHQAIAVILIRFLIGSCGEVVVPALGVLAFAKHWNFIELHGSRITWVRDQFACFKMLHEEIRNIRVAEKPGCSAAWCWGFCRGRRGGGANDGERHREKRVFDEMHGRVE